MCLKFWLVILNYFQTRVLPFFSLISISLSIYLTSFCDVINSVSEILLCLPSAFYMRLHLSSGKRQNMEHSSVWGGFLLIRRGIHLIKGVLDKYFFQMGTAADIANRWVLYSPKVLIWYHPCSMLRYWELIGSLPVVVVIHFVEICCEPLWRFPFVKQCNPLQLCLKFLNVCFCV